MELGHASGWKIEPTEDGWKWSVYTPAGSRSGTGTNYLNCDMQIEQAYRELGKGRPKSLDDCLGVELAFAQVRSELGLE